MRMDKIITTLAAFMCMLSVKATEYSVGWELWYPYQYHNKQRELVGFDINAFDAIMKQADVKYNITEIPWKTHLNFVKNGTVDIAMGASWTEERAKYAYFSIPYRRETVNLFVKNGEAMSMKINTLADLIGSPYLIGVESGYFYGNNYDKLINNPQFKSNIIEAIDLENNVALFLNGHLHGLLVDPYTMKAFVDKYQLKGVFEVHPVEVYNADIYIMFSKKTTDKQLVEKVNSAILHLTKNGQLTNVSNNWSVENKK